VNKHNANIELVEVKIDQSLIAAIAAQQNSALEQLYRRYARLILHTANHILHNRQEAEDLVHDVFLEIWRCAKQYDAKRGSVRSWLLLRVRCRALDRLRRHRSLHNYLVSSIGSASISPTPEQLTDAGLAQHALNTLSNQQRYVITLHYWQGLSHHEIAQYCQIPIGTVKSRLSAALLKLRSKMKSP